MSLAGETRRSTEVPGRRITSSVSMKSTASKKKSIRACGHPMLRSTASQSIILTVCSTALRNTSGSLAQNWTMSGRSSGHVWSAAARYFSSRTHTPECHMGV